MYSQSLIINLGMWLLVFTAMSGILCICGFKFKEKAPFPFLELPREIRDGIYGHILPSARFDTERLRTCERRGPIHILLTNRQIYEEACHYLYLKKKLIFVVDEVPWEVQGLRFRPDFRATLLLGSLGRHVSLVNRIQHVELEIGLPSWSWYNPCHEQYARFRGMEAFLANLETLCLTIEHLPQLRTLTISWKHPPQTYCDAVLLHPLKAIRKVIPGVTIKMPVGYPVDTAELARQQLDTESSGTHLE